MNQLRRATDTFFFIIEYALSLIFDRRHNTHSSYMILRSLYRLTKGKSSVILWVPYKFRFASKTKPSQHFKKMAAQLKEDGYCEIVGNGKIAEVCKEIKSVLDKKQVVDWNGKCFSNIKDLQRSMVNRVPRADSRSWDVVAIPSVWQLIKLLELKELADTYLECDSVLTQIQSWYVIPADGLQSNDSKYKEAAQCFHYDLDWVRFIKFFVALSDIDNLSGPFEYCKKTHRQKDSGYYSDRRLPLQQIQKNESVVQAYGSIGDTFAADTSGIHRDGQSHGQLRHVLQYEFAVAPFGASCQYKKERERDIEAISAMCSSGVISLSGRSMKLYT